MIISFAWLICGLVAVPLVLLVAECLAGLRRQSSSARPGNPPPITVLMPAHDEEAGIARAVQAVQAQLRPRDRIFVIADNCTDDTATIAAGLGATVIERCDPGRCGKGYALEAGRAAVEARPGEIVIIVDADCHSGPDALLRLADTAARRHAVVQGAYLLLPREGANPLVQLSCFAFLVKNLVRQIGLQRLSGLALLQGSGMAFPWSLLREADFCPASIVEDVHMGLKLVLAGETVAFDPDARFFSEASSTSGTKDQRRRWEHGLLATAGSFVPRLVRSAVTERPSLLMIALDLIIPPTVPLVAAAVLALILAFALEGTTAPVLMLATLLALLALALLLAWNRHARGLLPRPGLVSGISYFFWKLPVAVQFVTNRQRQWTRTEREP